ncbi:MAG: hypothetical protein SVR94_10680 [Pseudomonadota bacterium]|nr:hypothetical protein [Pseudomonadota bacterium]
MTPYVPVAIAHRIQLGISLIEMAIVLMIISFLATTVLSELSTYKTQHRIVTTQAQLETIKQALIGFALLESRLPCADLNQDGQEELDCQAEGFLPWANLALQGKDAWGRPFRYRVAKAFTEPAKIHSLTAESRLNIFDHQQGYWLSNKTPDTRVAAVIFSCGANGRPEADNDADGLNNPDILCYNPGDANNTYNHSVYIRGEFDDILSWLSKNLLFQRLIQAGQYS